MSDVAGKIGSEVASGAYNAVNEALLGAPAALLKNLPESILDSMGGRQAVLDFINKKGLGTNIGKGIGYGVSSFIPYFGQVGKIKGAAGIAANLGAAVGEEAAREAIAGQKISPESLGMAGAGGAVGYGAGKALGLAGKAFQKPTKEVISDITKKADKDLVAGVIGARTADVHEALTGDLGLASHQRIEDVLHTAGEAMRKEKIENPSLLPNFIDKVKARYKKLDATGVSLAETRNGKMVIDPTGTPKVDAAIKFRIDNLPSVKNIRGIDARKIGLPEATFDDTLKAATFVTDEMGNPARPATLGESMRVLSDRAGAALGIAKNYSGADPKIPSAARAYAQALEDARHELMGRAAEKAGENLEELSRLWPVVRLAENSLARNAARVTAPGAGSGTSTAGAITGLLTASHPVAGVVSAAAREPVNTLIGQGLQNARTAAAMTAPARAASPLGQAGIAAKRAVTGIPASGLARLGAAAGGQLVAGADEGNDVGAGFAPTPGEPTMQQAQFKATGGGPAMSAGAPAPRMTPNFTLLDETGQPRQNALGYKANAMDSAIEKNLPRVFTNMGGNLFPANRQDTEFQNFKRRLMENIHAPDGSLRPAIAARVLFPGSVQDQEHFSNLVSLLSAIGESSAGMKSQQGPAGAIRRVVDPKMAIDYPVLKGLVGKIVPENQKEFMDAFDRAMINPVPGDRQKMILDAIKRHDPVGVQLMQEAGINLW